MSTMKWIGSLILAILFIGVIIGVLAILASVAAFVFGGIAVVGCVALVTYGIRQFWNSKSKVK